MRSVEEIGINHELRSGAWVIPSEKDPGMYDVLHWGSLLEGARMAYEKDKLRPAGQKNAAVQRTVREGLHGVIYSTDHRCPEKEEWRQASLSTPVSSP